MGQYQQWLHYSAIDQRLRAELQALEIQVAELQRKNAHLLEHTPPTDNTIISKLTTSSNALTSSPKSTISPPRYTEQAHASRSSIVPNSNHQEQQGTHPEEAEKSAADGEKYYREAYLKEEGYLEDEHSQTEPQLELPWWLRNMIISASSTEAGNASSTSPIDKESIRTNRLVERWRERWGTHHPWMEGEETWRAADEKPWESEKHDE